MRLTCSVSPFSIPRKISVLQAFLDIDISIIIMIIKRFFSQPNLKALETKMVDVSRKVPTVRVAVA